MVIEYIVVTILGFSLAMLTFIAGYKVAARDTERYFEDIITNLEKQAQKEMKLNNIVFPTTSDGRFFSTDAAIRDMTTEDK